MGLASINRVELMGGLGKDPEVHMAEDGKKLVSLDLATTEHWKGNGGVTQEKTQWHHCVAFGKTAEICEKYLHKGSHVYIEGSLMNVKWQTDEGRKVSGTRVKIIQVHFLDKKGQAAEPVSDPGDENSSEPPDDQQQEE